MPRRLLLTCLCLLAGMLISASGAAAASGLTLTVTTTADPDNTAGQCATDGPCSLREAVNQADADTGDTIVVPAGTYGVDPTLGAIQLQSPMTITGAGAPGTFVDGQGTSGILHLLAGAVASVTGVTLENGETAASGGAALVDSGSSLTLSDCALTHNRAAVGGGAIEDQGAVTIQDCTLAANAATTVGGAIDATSATNPMLSVSDSTITGNSGMTAGGGLALSASTSQMTVDGDTIDANFGHSGGNVSVTTALPQFENTIVADGLGSPNCDAAIVSLGHNLEDGTSCGFTAPGDLSGVDPMLGPLQDNGGPTQTMSLLPGSPAIDAGAGQCDASDQRGVSRPQGLVCDIGAYEVAPPAGGLASTLSLSSSEATIIVSAANPDAQAGSLSLQYGATTDYGSTTSAQTLPAVTPPAGYTFTISGLAAGQTYHVRAVAENPDGIVDGPDLTFTTVPPPVPVPAPVPVPPPSPPPAPAAATQPATAIGASVATLHAVVHTGGAAASVTFQYGTSPALTGARSTPAQTVSATTAQAQVSATVSGLTSGRTYYFRAVATSMPGAVRAVGPVARFTTLKRITAKVTFASAVSSESAAKVTRLVVPQAPVGATVTVLCAGKGTGNGTGCPYAKRTMLVRAPKPKCTAGKCAPKKPPSTVSLDLTGPFRNRALPFGATVTVRMTQAGFVGEAYVFTMARRVHPASGCLAPGATRPSAIC